MTELMLVLLIIVALVVLGMAAARWGTDSRETDTTRNEGWIAR